MLSTTRTVVSCSAKALVTFHLLFVVNAVITLLVHLLRHLELAETETLKRRATSIAKTPTLADDISVCSKRPDVVTYPDVINIPGCVIDTAVSFVDFRLNSLSRRGGSWTPIQSRTAATRGEEGPAVAASVRLALAWTRVQRDHSLQGHPPPRSPSPSARRCAK